MTLVLIDRTLGTNIGDMTGDTGLAAAFDGETGGDSAEASGTGTGNASRFCGKTLASSKRFGQVIVYPSNNGFISAFTGSVTLTIYGKVGPAPGSATNGTSIGSSTQSDSDTPVTIPSTDLVSLWDHIWVTISAASAGTRRLIEVELYEDASSGYTIVCDTVGFSELGISSTLSVSLPGTTSNYTLSGIAATLTKSTTRLAAVPAAFILSGFSSNLQTTDALSIGADSASFVLSGKVSTFPITRSILGSAASFVLTGRTINFLITHKLSASVTVFAVTGNQGGFIIDVNNNRIYVKYLGVWKQPEPYVKYNDVWVVPDVYVKHDSVWKLVYGS